MKTVMEHERFMEFCDQSWNSTNFGKECGLRKFAFFQQMSQMQNLKREMVMENIEMVMEKSWIFLFAKSMGILIMYRHLICRLRASYDLHRLSQKALLVLVCVI